MIPDHPRPALLKGEVLSRIMVSEWIDMAAKRTPDLACLVLEDETTYSFAQVRDRVYQLARGLQALGYRKGDRVAILATDVPEYVETVLALFKIGAVCVPLNYRLVASEIETLMKASESTAIFVGERYVPMILEMKGRLPYLHLIVGFDATEGTVFYEDVLKADPGGELEAAILDDDDILTLAYTSGTTGLPKGVMQSHRMMKNSSANVILEFQIRKEEFRYTASPLYHVAGMGLVIKGVARGCTSLILPQFKAEQLLGWFRKGLTGVFLVPTMISTILRLPGVSPEDFTSLKSVFYGSAPMTPGLLVRAMEIMQCNFYNGFGAGTEAAGQTVFTPEDHHRAMNGEPHLLGSIGRPGYNVDLQIWDDECNEVEPGSVGEIVTRSDMVMGGYLGQPEKTAESIINGWFRGGDLGWMDDEGYIYLAGRKHDMIIRGGENIYPLEIETVLLEWPGIIECAVVGVDDEHWGEIVRAHIVMAEGTSVDVEELRAFLRSRLASYKVPEEIRVETELVKNASGKILRRVLKTIP